MVGTHCVAKDVLMSRQKKSVHCQFEPIAAQSESSLHAPQIPYCSVITSGPTVAGMMSPHGELFGQLGESARQIVYPGTLPGPSPSTQPSTKRISPAPQLLPEPSMGIAVD